MIEILAEFCGVERSPITNSDVSYCYPAKPFELFKFNPLEDANDTELVEERLREKGLGKDYCAVLVHLAMSDEYGLERCADWPEGIAEIYAVVAATKQQRMEAAVKVIT